MIFFLGIVTWYFDFKVNLANTYYSEYFLLHEGVFVRTKTQLSLTKSGSKK